MDIGFSYVQLVSFISISQVPTLKVIESVMMVVVVVVVVVVMVVVVMMKMMENTNCITMDEAQWSLALAINGIEFWFYGVTRSEFPKTLKNSITQKSLTLASPSH